MKRCPYCCEEILDDAIKCRHCGELLSEESRPPLRQRRLHRSSRERMLSGVCGGLAEYLDIDPTLIRLVAVLLVVFSLGLPGVVAYLVAALVMPEDVR